MNTTEIKQIEAIAAFETEVQAAVDPLPAATLGMYLFLASEAMFFVGLMGAYIVLKSAGGAHEVFVRSATVPSGAIAATGVGLLIISSSSVARKQSLFLWFALASAITFLLLQYMQLRNMIRGGFGSSHDNYCGCYFLITGVHVVHLLAGIAAVFWFLRNKRLPDSVQIYWHFVNAMGVCSIAALYWM